VYRDKPPYSPEPGTSLFQIAQSLIALERTFISAAKERFNKMSKEWQAN